ncbi:hypothetical protein ES703_96728 [subsurface metagenome]
MKDKDYMLLDLYLEEVRKILFSHEVAHKMRTKPLTKDWKRAIKYLDKVYQFANSMMTREHPNLIDRDYFEYVPPPPVDDEERREWESIYLEEE